MGEGERDLGNYEEARSLYEVLAKGAKHMTAATIGLCRSSVGGTGWPPAVGIRGFKPAEAANPWHQTPSAAAESRTARGRFRSCCCSFYELLLMASPTEVNVSLALLPSWMIAKMQTTMMRANITAYSTAVGPSS